MLILGKIDVLLRQTVLYTNVSLIFSKRASYDKLLQHGYFDDYIAKQREIELEIQNENRNIREKSKISLTSLPQLPSTQVPMINNAKNYSRADHHLPTI